MQLVLLLPVLVLDEVVVAVLVLLRQLLGQPCFMPVVVLVVLIQSLETRLAQDKQGLAGVELAVLVQMDQLVLLTQAVVVVALVMIIATAIQAEQAALAS
jgi:hypothetical protein